MPRRLRALTLCYISCVCMCMALLSDGYRVGESHANGYGLAVLLEAPATSSVNSAALAAMHGGLVFIVDYSNLIWSSNAVVLGANWPSNLSLEHYYILDVVGVVVGVVAVLVQGVAKGCF